MHSSGFWMVHKTSYSVAVLKHNQFSCPKPSSIPKIMSALLQQSEAFRQIEDHLYNTVDRMHESTSMIFSCKSCVIQPTANISWSK